MARAAAEAECRPRDSYLPQPQGAVDEYVPGEGQTEPRGWFVPIPRPAGWRCVTVLAGSGA
jgi:hypothetical protein